MNEPPSKRRAREEVRQHWITYILNADCAFDCDSAVREVWSDECQRIATRIERATKARAA